MFYFFNLTLKIKIENKNSFSNILWTIMSFLKIVWWNSVLWEHRSRLSKLNNQIITRSIPHKLIDKSQSVYIKGQNLMIVSISFKNFKKIWKIN